MVSSPNRVLTPLKSASNILISSFVAPSQIFVWDSNWEGYIYQKVAPSGLGRRWHENVDKNRRKQNKGNVWGANAP
jgi:hypothetical protein